MVSFYSSLVKRAKKEGINHYSSRAVIIEDEKILFLEKSSGHYNRGKLELPGGKKRKNESILNTLRREILEETGKNVISDKYIGYFDVCCKDKKIREYVFLVRIEKGELKINRKEHSSVLWIGKEEMKRYKIIDESLDFLLSYLNEQ